MAYRRSAAHAGSWYDDSSEVLGEQLKLWLKKAAETTAAATSAEEQQSRIIIAPHAGYSYSGPTAAHAYAQLDLVGISRVFVLGPSHHLRLRGCAISAARSFETPLGDLPGDSTTVADLLKTGKFEVLPRGADEAEHSIEMHLPYIAQRRLDACGTLEGCAVVCIVVGSTDPGQEAEYGRLLEPLLADARNAFVVSSDFCHWGSRFGYQPHDPSKGEVHEYIRWLDHLGMDLVEQADVKGFYRYLEEHRNTICGRHPIGILLQALQEHHRVRSVPTPSIRFVSYAQSSAAKSKRCSSVSYASAVVRLAGPQPM